MFLSFSYLDLGCSDISVLVSNLLVIKKPLTVQFTVDLDVAEQLLCCQNDLLFCLWQMTHFIMSEVMNILPN